MRKIKSHTATVEVNNDNHVQVCEMYFLERGVCFETENNTIKLKYLGTRDVTTLKSFCKLLGTAKFILEDTQFVYRAYR